MTLRIDEPGTASVAGAKLPAAPESASETLPVNPASGVSLTVNRALAPWLALADAGSTATTKSGRSTTWAVVVAVAWTPFTFVTVVRSVNEPVLAYVWVPTTS